MTDYIALAVEDLGTAGNLSEYAGNVTLSGLIIVFSMLVILVLVIFVFGLIMGGSGKNKKVKPVKSQDTKSAVKNTVSAEAKPSAPVNMDSNEDENVIAAISAAVMMMYEGTGKTPVIRSIKPAVKGVRSAWQAAGIANNTRPF